MQLDPVLIAAARRRNGLVTVAEWCAAGRTARSFNRAIAAGLLVRVAPGVAALVGTEPGPVQRIHAEVLSCRVAALASHRSAAFLWGAPIIGDRPVDLLALDPSGASRRDGVRIHRATDRDDLRPVPRHRVPTTSAVRTLLDLGAVQPAAVVGLLEVLLVGGQVTLVGVERALARHRRRGRAGISALEAAASDVAFGNVVPDSVLEARLARLFAAHGIGGAQFHAVVEGFEVDVAFPAERVAIEVDGFAFHADRVAFERDRARDAALAAAGWLVVRFTWRQVTGRPGAVAAQIRATRAARAAPSTAPIAGFSGR